MKLLTFKNQEEYNKLKHLPFNREFRYRDDLASKMNTYGFQGAILLIETDLISGKKELFVADGQHRALTANRLGIPFYGTLNTEIEFKSISDIVLFVASLNSTQKKWSADDYIRAYCYLNFKEYKTLVKIKQGCPFSSTTVASMLLGFRSKGFGVRHLEEGTFVCNLLEETKYTLSLAAKLSKYGTLTSRMALALHYVASLKTFDEEKFTKKYKENYKIIRELKLDDYSDIFSSWL